MEFIEDRRWRLVWFATALCCAGLLGSLFWQWRLADLAIREERERIDAVQPRLQKMRVPIQSKADPRHASNEQAAQLLQQDLNKAFATAENLQKTGVRLRSLSLETATDSLRLEYDLDSVAKASVVTQTLNDGYDHRPWQLESVSGTAGTGLTGVVPMVSSMPGFRGIWSAPLNKL
jgi:hypothetical protein